MRINNTVLRTDYTGARTEQGIPVGRLPPQSKPEDDGGPNQGDSSEGDEK